MSVPRQHQAKFSLHTLNENTFYISIECSHPLVSASDIMPILSGFGLCITKKIVEHKAHYHYTYVCRGLLPGPHFLKALEETWNKQWENDTFNLIIVATSLTPSAVNILRAYAHYLQQLSFPENQDTIAHVLAQNPYLTQLLYQCLDVHLDRDLVPSFAMQNQLLQSRLQSLSPSHQYIFQTYLYLFEATARLHTDEHSCVAFKLQTHNLSCVPEPRPFYESFVYSPRVEGVHLRWGRIARGGIRCSDRDDYRYEILDLVKAQTLKNAIIVPTGAKGGFLCRNLVKQSNTNISQAEREDEKRTCYQIFIQGLLNLIDISPSCEPTFPHHEVDAYFVVAADKGTSSFSDLANRLAQEQNFWLDDAFASGGSNGYNHKKMGITARGAWISLECHRQRLGLSTPLSFVGVGDMSGDVFGNGLLHPVKLIAAFDHRHIFIDPCPEVNTSLHERQRLFHLPSSSWQDYNPHLISEGGGVFNRADGYLTISPNAAQALDIKPGRYTTQEVIQSILKAPVDVLWFGGIGTFVKSPNENNNDIRDRANDILRVDGHTIKARIVVEGANLGMTQGGRVAYALEGGMINTDATDNSAGVDCSDHEVNIKIYLRHKKIPAADIHLWLEAMAEDVTMLVLQNNINQNHILNIMEQESKTYEPLRQYLKQKNIHEGLPQSAALSQRMHHNWTRPELCYLLAYIKNDFTLRIHHAIDHIPPNLFQEDVIAYFPQLMQNHFSQDLCNHPLHDSLLSTILANHIINTWGPMWALPASPLQTWLPAYHWLRSKRMPNKIEEKSWQILISYFQKFHHKNQMDLAYQLMWNTKIQNENVLWQHMGPGLLNQPNIPAVWDLGALLIDSALNTKTLPLSDLPTNPNMTELVHALFNIQNNRERR